MSWEGNGSRLLGQSCELTLEGAGKLLSILAPVVMGAVGKTKRQNALDENGLASVLACIRSETSSSPQTASLLSLLDGDGDGQVIDDLGDFLGRFLK